MSYQQKLSEVRALLEQHNSQIPVDIQVAGNSRLNVDKFFSNLAAAGGTNEAGLNQCTWEDLQEFGLPKLLARQVAGIFRTKEEKPTFVKKSKVEAMTVKELIDHYDPRSPVSLVTDRLVEIMDKKHFIVFNDDASVNKEVSVKLAQEILDGFPQREFYLVDAVTGVSVKTYSIGERPDQSYDGNPLYPGRILRPDGDCDQTNRSWSGVILEVKQILYLAVTNKELKIDSIHDAHNVMDHVVGDNTIALRHVRLRYPKSAAHLKELQAQGNAPSLKVFKKTEVKNNNPFGSNRTY